MNSPITPTQPDPEPALLARALRLVLTWSCPLCGQAWPCRCDEAGTIPQLCEADDASSD